MHSSDLLFVVLAMCSGAGMTSCNDDVITSPADCVLSVTSSAATLVVVD